MLTSDPKRHSARDRPRSIVFVLNDGNTHRTGTADVPQSLSLVAFKDELEFSYLLDNFVWRTYGTPWLEMSCSGKLGELPLSAARAFAQSVFGKHHHQKGIELQGQTMYGHTIGILSKELGHVARLGSEDLIIPVLLLLMHSSTAVDRQATVFHVTGLSRVIQSCEPARFAKMPLRLAFESARSTLFTIGLIAKKRIFLEQPVWKTMPWQGPGASPKNPQNELVDILVNMPGYIEDSSLVQNGSASGEQRAHLIACLKDDLALLSHWRWKWEQVNPNAAWEVEVAHLPCQRAISTARLFEKVLWFRSFTHATEILLYNAVLLCLLGALWQFEPPSGRDPQMRTSSPLLLPNEVESLFEPAEEICRGFEYQLLNINNSRESALFWLMPLGVAAKVLEEEEEYGAWIRTMLNTSKVTRGYGSGTNEFAFGHYQFPHLGRPKRREKTAQ